MKFYFSVKAPHHWAHVDGKGKILDQGVVQDLALLVIKKNAEVIAVAPGSDVVCHKVSVPSRSRSKVMAALPYALEEIISSDIDDVHVALLDWKGDQEVIAAVVDRVALSRWLDLCRAAGIRVDRLVPDYLLLPVHPQSRMTLARQQDGIVSIREERPYGMALDTDMLTYWWMELKNNALAIAVNDTNIARQLIELNGTQVSDWNIGDRFTQWLDHGGGWQGDLDLLQGKYLPDHRQQRTGGLKAAAIIALVALLINTSMNIVELWRLQQQSEKKDAAVVGLFRQVFPDTKRNFTYSHYMSKVQQVKSAGVATGDFQFLLAALARAFPQSRSSVQELNFRENVLVVTCVMGNFEELDRLQKRFESDTLISVKLLSSVQRDDKTSGRFELVRRTNPS